MANEFGSALFAAGLIALVIFYKLKVKDERLTLAAGVATFVGLLIAFLF
jgi:hypothetical protein